MAARALSLSGRKYLQHLSNISLKRNIMTSNVQRAAEEAMEKLKANPYFEKYATKIASLQQTSPEAFLSKLADHEKEQQRKRDIERGNKFSSTGMPKPKKSVLRPSGTKEKRLDDIMKADLLKDKTADEIKNIWESYYKDKDSVVAIIPADLYKIQYDRSLEFSTFLFSLPRDQGYEFIVCQFSGHECHFTSLVNYQAYKENAPECLTLVNYVELAEEKGIVLMHGEFDKDVMNVQEAQCLANQMQMYYTQKDEKKLNLLRRFTYNPNDFRHMDLIAEMESFKF